MRTVPQAWLDNMQASRVVNARATFRDNRLVFGVINPTENVTPTVSDAGKTDGSLYGTGFLRVANADDGYLWYQYVSDPTQATWPDWVQSTIQLNAASKPGVKGGRIWYQASDGSIKYVDFDGAVLGTPVSVDAGDATWRMAFAPVSADDCYVHWYPYASDLTVNYGKLARLNTSGTWGATWSGAVYGDKTDVYRFDAVRLNGVDHVYTIDHGTGRTLVIKVADTVFSDAKFLVPLDIVDTDSFFRLGNATVIDSRVFVTGRLARGKSIEMDAYTIGPEHYTFGRDMFIVSNVEFGSDAAAKFFLVGDTLYYVGLNYQASAPATNLVGYDSASRKLVTQDFVDFRTGFIPNSAAQLDMTLNSSLNHAAIRKGSEVELEVGIGPGDGTFEYVKLATFGVDGISKDIYGEGSEQIVVGRSNAIKRLSQWTSDAFYDYWSQAKMSSDPAALDEVVRTTGHWDADEGQPETPLYLTRLNEEGVLYSVARASRGGLVRGKFKKDSSLSGYDPLFGVVLNYYRENRQEAAERLDKDPSDVKDDEFGHNGIQVLWGDDQHSGGAGVAVYRWVAGTQTFLTSAALSIPDNTWVWLQAHFQEGQIRVLYREHTSSSWTEVLSYRYITDGDIAGPWQNEGRGRGAIYIQNRTTFSTTPGFSSTSQIIPVADNSSFPASETVIVDEEQIDYVSKSPNIAGPGQKTIIDGYTWLDADHNNPNWINGLVFRQNWLQTLGELTIGKDKTECVYAGNGFTCNTDKIRIDKLRVPVKKVGAPGTLYAYFVTDDFDNYNPPYQPGVMFSASVAHTAVGTTYDWVEFDFTGAPEQDRWLYPENFWVFLTTMPPGDTNYDAYQDASNYYLVDMNESTANALGVFRFWSTSGAWDAYYDHNPTDATMPLELYGISNNGDGNEIYLDGAESAVARDVYNDMAAVVVSGPGKGSVFTITDFDYQAPAQWEPSRTYLAPDKWQDHVGDPAHGTWVDVDACRLFVKEGTGSRIGEGSVIEIMPALIVGTRAANGTTETSHGAGNVNVYRDASVDIDQMAFYSTEMDMRIEDMARELVRKAGVLGFSSEKSLEGVQSFAGAGWNSPQWFERRNCIVKFQMPALAATDEVGVICRTLTNPSDIGTVSQGYIITLDANDNLKFYKYDAGWSVIETFPMDITPSGEVTISVQGNHFSVWVNERFIHAFYENDYEYGTHAGLITYDAVDVDVDWSALDLRTDNFVLDMGHRGAQLLNSLIGPKRIFYLDDQDGGIRMGRMRSSGAADYTANDFSVERANTELDAEQLSRVRAEGAEIAEVTAFDTLREEGNLFALANATEANDYWETHDEALQILRDAASSAKVKSPKGLLDPRIEPQDIVQFGSFVLLVDSVSISLTQGENEALMDMDIEARDATP